MSDEEAFLQTIRENPGDDRPKLVYADWLEERGDPRGEFIRLTCELNRLRRRMLTIPARIAELAQHLDAQWLVDVFGHFRIMLLNYALDKKIPVIKALRQVTGYSLKQSKDLSEALPSIVLDGVTWDVAERVRRLLADIANVTVEPSTLLEPFPPGAPFVVPNYRIILRSHLRGAKLQTIKALRSVTSIGAGAARELVESLPRVLCERATLEDVERYRAAFRPFAEIDSVPMNPTF